MSTKKLIEELRRRLDAEPSDLKLLAKLADELQRIGDNVGAADALARIAELFQRDGFLFKEAALLKHALRVDSERHDLEFRVGVALLRLGLLPEASPYLRKCVLAAKKRGGHGLPVDVSLGLLDSEPDGPQFRLFLAHVLLFAERREEVREALQNAAIVLSAKHAGLATRIAAFEIGTDDGSRTEELAAIAALRREVDRELELESAIQRLEFSQPN